MRHWTRWGLASALLVAAAASPAQPPPVVLELFTSEGCNTCPPAEAYLGTVSARADVLALAFHVDYWDSLGWRDRFALSQAAERQKIYARNFHRSSVYTPQLVIDGRSDPIGSYAAAVASALGRRPDGVPLMLAVRAGTLRVDVGARADGPPSDVLLIAYLHHAVSAIGNGENAGRTLEEFNIVRAIRALGSWSGEPRSFDVALASLPTDATDAAVLVQPSGQAPIIGALARTIR
jgi:hypothetical protein